MPESEWLNGPIREALLRGRASPPPDDQPDAEPAAEPAAGDFDAGVRAPAPPKPPGMNEHLRAAIRAHRRSPLPEDYDL